MTSRERSALVLGGGGPLGFAWEAGLLQGWAESWQADTGGRESPFAPLRDGRIIGTSAGAIVAAHLALHDSVHALLAPGEFPDAARGAGMVRFLLAYLKARLLTRSLEGFRRSMGKSARRAALPGEKGWIEALEQAVASKDGWPASRDLRITAIDAETGEFHSWTAGSGVPLVHAVAASCSAPCIFPLVHLRGHAYMDGGIGSSTNAGLAAGCARVLILDPLGRMAGKNSPIRNERRVLEASGSRTLTFLPDRTVANAIGRHFLDVSRRGQVAELARAQGHATASGVWDFLQGRAREPVPSLTN